MILQPRYNDPTLTQEPERFFLEVMRATNLPIHTRMHAAEQLLKIWPDKYCQPTFKQREHWPGETGVTIVIGGLPSSADVQVVDEHNQPPTPGTPSPHGQLQ